MRVPIAHRIPDALLESLDGTAKIETDIAQLLRAKHQHHHDKDHDPMPDAQATNVLAPAVVEAFQPPM